MAHISKPVLGLSDGRGYMLEVHPVEPDDDETDRYHVAVRDDRYGKMLSFIGTSHDLHTLFLGLHNVLVDAGQADSHESVLIIPGRGEVEG